MTTTPTNGADHMAATRSIYDGLVTKATRVIPVYSEFLVNSGHTASYAVPIPHDKTLLEIMGIKPDKQD